MLKKEKIQRFGEHYLIGIRKSDGKKIYLKKEAWDCDWYWGFGYLHVFCPGDIAEMFHFDAAFLGNWYKNELEMLDEYFSDTVLSEKETYQFLELMQTAYTLRKYSDTLHIGGAHYTTNPLKDLIKNEEEYNRINKVVLPAIFEEIRTLLTKKEEN